MARGLPIDRLLPQHRRSAQDRKSTRLNSSHQIISYAVFCLKKKKYVPAMLPPQPPPIGTRVQDGIHPLTALTLRLLRPAMLGDGVRRKGARPRSASSYHSTL